jgi:hypothetical protein
VIASLIVVLAPHDSLNTDETYLGKVFISFFESVKITYISDL